jgi:hypothetical protein
VLDGPWTSRWIRSDGWRFLAPLAALSTVGFVAVAPTRPWWPALTLLEGEHQAGNASRQRLASWYRFFRERPHDFDRLLDKIPSSMDRIGLLAPSSVAESPAWRPYGRRRIVRPNGDRSPADFLSHHVTYVLVRDANFSDLWPRGLADWLARGSAEELGNVALAESPVDPPVRWILVRLKGGPP